MAPSVRARFSLEPKPICAIVSVTMVSGINFIAPSSSRNRMTRLLNTRPVQSAAVEMGAVSAIVDIALSRYESAFRLSMFIPRSSRSSSVSLPKDEQRNDLPTSVLAIFADPRRPNSARGLSGDLRCAVADQAVDMHPNVGGFRRGIGE